MIKRVKIHESDISWSSFTTLPQEKKDFILLEVENLLNEMVFAKDKDEMDVVFKNYILTKDDNKQRINRLVKFLHFNDRKGHIYSYELNLENSKIVATVRDSKTKKVMVVEEGFYGWKPHRIYNGDIVNLMYRILYHQRRPNPYKKK